jgi:hypothetical protein
VEDNVPNQIALAALSSIVRHRMRYAQILVVLAALTSSVVAEDQSVCSGLPVVTSEAAVCRLELHFVREGVRKVKATFEAEERQDHWLVLHLPESSGVRAGGARFKVDKATGSVELVELLELVKAPASNGTPNTSLERMREK